MLHYAVTPEGQVFSFRREKDARAAVPSKGAYGNDTSVSEIPTPLLIILHNIIRPERPVTRFSDRATAEKRMQGVLEVLAKPGTVPEEPSQPQDSTSDTSLTQGEDSTMATTATKRKRSSTAATRGTEITETEVKRVLDLRAKGKTWEEVMATMGKSVSFVHRVRPLMKKIDKKSVLAIGPGSPNYGKGGKKK